MKKDESAANVAQPNGANTGLASISEAYAELLRTRPGFLASESGGELAWIKKARERDALRWRSMGFPSRKDERWRYTSLATLERAHFILPSLNGRPERQAYPQLKQSASAEIVFFNGQYVPEWSSISDMPGVSVIVLSELFAACVNDGWTSERRQQFAAFREHLEALDARPETVFAAMNTSFMQDGVLLYVKPGVVVRDPIVVTNISDAEPSLSGNKADALAVITPRLFAHLDRGAQAGLIELYLGGKQHPYFATSVTDIRLEAGARISHCQVQLEGDQSVHMGTTRVHQKKSSFSECFQFSFGAKLSRQDLHVSLEGAGAEAMLDGLYMVKGNQHVDNYTLVEHTMPDTTSGQVYKGIVNDEARAVFNGHLRIHRDAQRSSASQLNNNLLLSPTAEVDTKPELEIDADDVKAAHGATIGQIDPEHIFYLQARAIPRAEAIRMLTKGFAQEIVLRIQNEPVREMIAHLVAHRFEEMQMGEST